jgi:starch phosphorylase
MSQAARARIEPRYVLTLEEIGKLAAEGGKPAETLMNVVALIAKRFETDVCSAYVLEPDRPAQAAGGSGTSGQKVVLNGGLNLSILDGWWAEAYDGLNGFAIGNGRTHQSVNVHDQRDGDDLYRVLREQVIPLYYQRDRDGLPRGWIRRMKRTIRTLGWRFNANRMVMDYTLKCYVPAAGGTSSDMSYTAV